MKTNNIIKLNHRFITNNRFLLSPKYRLFLMALPFIVLVFLFNYLPLWGWIYAFFDYKPGLKLSECVYRGVYFFAIMFNGKINSIETLRVMKNTFGISLLGYLTTPLPVFFAIFLLEIRTNWYKKLVQTLTTLPNFLSWILVYAFAFAMFSTDDGFLNRLLMNLKLIDHPVNYLVSSQHVWLTQTAYSVWKGLGWSAIIYLAAIVAIEKELYEAAKADGAGRFTCIWHITIPGILPTYFVLLLLSIASFLNNGIGQYYTFSNSMNKDTIEVLDLYVYNIGIKHGAEGFNYSFATAIGILKSLVSVVLLLTANVLAKKVRGEKII